MEGVNNNNNSDVIAYLPEEIMVNILLLLPAQILHNVMRYVCRQWYNIIRDPVFVNTHLQQSTTGLLMKNPHLNLAYVLENGRKGLIKKNITFPTPGKVHASCDGLILFSDDTNKGALYVANPVTNQQITLPSLLLDLHHDNYLSSFCLARSRVAEEYKVLYQYCQLSKDPKIQWRILTLGADNAWRPIVTQSLGRNSQGCLWPRTSFAIDGLVYTQYTEFIVTLEVEAETLSYSPVPEEFQMERCFYDAMGSFLSAVIKHHDTLTQWDVWVLVDYKTGMWTKLYKIDLEPQPNLLKRIFRAEQIVDQIQLVKKKMSPLGWIDNGNVLVLNQNMVYDVKIRGRHVMILNQLFVAYNVKTGESSKFFELKMSRTFFPIRKLIDMNSIPNHVSSLVRFNSN